MTSDADVKPVAAKPARAPHRTEATDKAAREILAIERKAMLAKTERLRAARLAAVPVAALDEPKATPARRVAHAKAPAAAKRRKTAG